MAGGVPGFPPPLSEGSTPGNAGGLNFRGRNETGCGPPAAMAAVPFHSSRDDFINFAVKRVTMEELIKLIHLERKPALTPERKVKDFLETLQRTKNGEDIRVRGFIILRKPPNAPRDGIYYLLSPLAPSEMKSYRGPRAYLVVKINEDTRIDARIQPGEYVEAEGILDAYPFGTLRLLHARRISPADYSEYWKDYRSLALSKSELENLVSDTIYASYELERAIMYSILTAPFVVGTNWLDGFTLSGGFKGLEGSKNVTLSLWEALKYIYSLLPWEMQLRRDRWGGEVEDDGFLGIDFRFTWPSRAGPPFTMSPTTRPC